jgi:hypothetical protein
MLVRPLPLLLEPGRYLRRRSQNTWYWHPINMIITLLSRLGQEGVPVIGTIAPIGNPGRQESGQQTIGRGAIRNPPTKADKVR